MDKIINQYFPTISIGMEITFINMLVISLFFLLFGSGYLLFSVIFGFTIDLIVKSVKNDRCNLEDTSS